MTEEEIEKAMTEFEEQQKRLAPIDNQGHPFDISIGSGWIDLVLELHYKLLEIDPNYIVSQCKEKFGMLRYYADMSQNEDSPIEQYHKFYDLIADAEATSGEICEVCGKPGKLVNLGGWWKTLCGECEKEK